MAAIGNYSEYPNSNLIFFKVMNQFSHYYAGMTHDRQQIYKFSFRLNNKMAANWIMLIG